jgi:ubiquinone/menaquinone biosynthesis C-methylase UbiE
MFPSFRQRSLQLERLDTGDYTAEEYSRWQVELRFVNRLLGDARALRLSLINMLRGVDAEVVSIVDVGAGTGELLKTAKEALGKRSGFLVGAELNNEAARAINARFKEFQVAGVQCNAIRLPFADNSFDFAVSSLFLHHLSDDEALILISEMARVSRRRFFIIDLHRHAVAYHLYHTFGRLFLQPFTHQDGSLSIMRSFRPKELRSLANRAGLDDFTIRRRAAFRLVLSGVKARK